MNLHWPIRLCDLNYLALDTDRAWGGRCRLIKTLKQCVPMFTGEKWQSPRFCALTHTLTHFPSADTPTTFTLRSSPTTHHGTSSPRRGPRRCRSGSTSTETIRTRLDTTRLFSVRKPTSRSPRSAATHRHNHATV